MYLHVLNVFPISYIHVEDVRTFTQILPSTVTLPCVFAPFIVQVNSAESSTSVLGMTIVWVVPSTETLYFFLSEKLKGLPFFNHVASTFGLEASQVKVTVSSFSTDTSLRGTVKAGDSSTKRYYTHLTLYSTELSESEIQVELVETKGYL